MNPKLVKLNNEYEKNKAKISDIQTRQREIERQRKEIEANEILGLVQSFNLDANGLAALLNKINTVSSAGVNTKEDYDNETEDN